jgi:hypothetical protein
VDGADRERRRRRRHGLALTLGCAFVALIAAVGTTAWPTSPSGGLRTGPAALRVAVSMSPVAIVVVGAALAMRFFRTA